MDVKNSINRILDGSEAQDLSNQELKDIRAAISATSRWDNIKSSGIVAIPPGDATKAFGRINKILRANGIYLVPVGELECFIKEVGGHGPEWVNKVLETYPNLYDQVYEPITQFIYEMNL